MNMRNEILAAIRILACQISRTCMIVKEVFKCGTIIAVVSAWQQKHFNNKPPSPWTTTTTTTNAYNDEPRCESIRVAIQPATCSCGNIFSLFKWDTSIDCMWSIRPAILQIRGWRNFARNSPELIPKALVTFHFLLVSFDSSLGYIPYRLTSVSAAEKHTFSMTQLPRTNMFAFAYQNHSRNIHSLWLITNYYRIDWIKPFVKFDHRKNVYVQSLLFYKLNNSLDNYCCMYFVLFSKRGSAADAPGNRKYRTNTTWIKSKSIPFNTKCFTSPLRSIKCEW